jgi:hypothetical protein
MIAGNRDSGSVILGRLLRPEIEVEMRTAVYTDPTDDCSQGR